MKISEDQRPVCAVVLLERCCIAKTVNGWRGQERKIKRRGEEEHVWASTVITAIQPPMDEPRGPNRNRE